MSNKPQPQALANAQAVTVQRDFWSATPNADKLFSVRGGVPLRDAFDQLSMLLSASMAAVEFAACEGNNTDDVPGALWNSVHLMNFTFELMQSMQQGLIEHEKR